MQELERRLESEGLVQQGWLQAELTPRLHLIAQHVARAAQRKFIRRRGLFELLGLDFMVDAALKPWLIEVNTNPALWMSTDVHRQVLPAVIRDTLHLVLEYHDKASCASTPLPVTSLTSYSPDKFAVLCDEALGTLAQYPTVYPKPPQESVTSPPTATAGGAEDSGGQRTGNGTILCEKMVRGSLRDCQCSSYADVKENVTHQVL